VEWPISNAYLRSRDVDLASIAVALLPSVQHSFVRNYFGLSMHDVFTADPR